MTRSTKLYLEISKFRAFDPQNFEKPIFLENLYKIKKMNKKTEYMS